MTRHTKVIKQPSLVACDLSHQSYPRRISCGQQTKQHMSVHEIFSKARQKMYRRHVT
jgi:hypothetical protein